MIKKINSHLFSNGLEYYYIKKKASLVITIEIWVNVGSSNELPHEYGICHMIEHMIFKGSEKIELGVLDTLFYMINGKTNAYTSKDFTVYTFSVPKDYFESLLEILFDLFDNPRFDEVDLLTEKEVVIQEIQLYEDDSYSKLFDESFINSSSQHNYQHEILGNRETVNSFSEKQLYDFYKKYYNFENMKLFILGDCLFSKIEKIINNSKFAKKVMQNNIKYINKSINIDTKIKKINYLYTETLNKHFLLTYLFPSCLYDKINLFKSLNLLLGGSKDSLLYQKLHIELKLVSDIRSFFHGLSKETYFFIYFNPISFDSVPLIMINIYAIIDNIIAMKYNFEKLEKIENILFFQHALLLSENSDDFISQYAPYAFEKKRNFLLYKKIPLELLKGKMSRLAKFFKHKNSILNAILPYDLNSTITKKDSINNNADVVENNNEIESQDIVLFQEEIVDLNALKEDRKEKIKKINDSGLLAKKNYLPKYVPFLKQKEIIFDNNLQAILVNDNEKSEIIVIVLSLKVKHYYDDVSYLGGIAFLFDWMYEGTMNYKNTQFIETIEKYGIEFSVNVGTIEIRCIKKYISIAIDLLADFLKNPEFSLDRFNLLKIQTIDGIKNFMDDSFSVGLQHIRELVYQDHPYAKNPSGDLQTVNALTPDIIKKLYDKYITPDEALLFFIGNIDETEITKLIQLHLLSWKYKKVESLSFPLIKNNSNNKINYLKIDKEQCVILYGGLSVIKYSQEFYYLLLADQLLSGSISDSMHAILFQIRDKSGMFYDISGSLVAGCGHDVGMIIIKAMTDKSNVSRAINNINNVINNFISFLTKEDLLIAKKSVLLAMGEKNDSKSSIINCFLNKYRYNLSHEDFMNHYNTIKNASLTDIKNTVKKYFNKDLLQVLIVQDEI